MKLVKTTPRGWEYLLGRAETKALRRLVRQFPISPAVAVKITRTDTDPKAAEREELLNESLAEHRAEIRGKALRLVTGRRLRVQSKGYRLRLNPDQRETLLQLFNDIRVGSWRMLGEPETMEAPLQMSEREYVCYHLINLAGYFEVSLLNLPA